MKKSLFFQKTCVVVTIVFFIIGISGCNMPLPSHEPMTWIDQPLDGAKLPLSPIMIQAHAADSDGVESIEFLIFEDLIASVSTGGTRLENASIEWKPQKSGEYTISVRAIDTIGNTNTRSMANVTITVGTDPAPASTLASLMTFTPTAATMFTETPLPADTLTPTPEISKPPILTPSISSNPVLILSQNAHCRFGPSTTFDSLAVLMQDETVLIEGRNTDNTWFWVRKPSGNGNCWVSSITGTTSGNLNVLKVIATPMVPPTNTPTFPTLEVLPVDTTPPSISNVSITPATVMQQGCGTPDTFTITATVTDESGIGNVIYEILGPQPDRWGEHNLLPVGGDIFQAIAGPYDDSVGTWTIRITATDMNYNSSQAGPWTVQFVCIQ